MMNDECKPSAVNPTRQDINLIRDFFEEIIDRPEVLERLPAQGQIEPRSIDVRGHVYLLMAILPPEEAVWTSYIVRSTSTTGDPAFQRPDLNERGERHDQAALVRSLTASGSTYDDALDALEHDLRERIDELLDIPATTGRRSAD